MKKYICFLLVCLTLVVASIGPTMASAANVIETGTVTVPTGYTWWHRGNGKGWFATRLKNQSCVIHTYEKGYTMQIGLQTQDNKKKYPIFLNCVNYDSPLCMKIVEMKYACGSYKPYVYNGSRISMTVLSDSYFKLQ